MSTELELDSVCQIANIIRDLQKQIDELKLQLKDHDQEVEDVAINRLDRRLTELENINNQKPSS